MKRIESVLIVHQPPKILLGFKNPEKKFGGKWNGFGGGLEGNETPEACAIRETFEETGGIITNLTKRGEMLLKFETNEQDHQLYIFETGDYEGTLDNSRDFIEYKWFHANELLKIYDQMMPADRHWFPFFINNKLFKGYAIFNKDFKVVDYKINEVKKLD